jgi:hypothetical protein
MGDIYQGEEAWFKLAKFMHNREQGMTIKESADDAQNWLFDYTEVPGMIDHIRRSPFLSPFITFTYKALPRIAESAVVTPWRMMMVVGLIYGIQDYSREKLGIAADEYKKIQKIAPYWMQGNMIGPKFILLPWKDRAGRLQFLDLTYILPWGDVGETGATGLYRQIPGVASPMMAVAELMLNKSNFTGREIYKEDYKGDALLGAKDRVAKSSLHIYRTVAPSMAPGGWGFSKLWAAGWGKEDYFGRERSIPGAVASTLFGLKVTGIDPAQEAARRLAEYERSLRDLGTEMRITQRNRSLSPEARKKKIEGIFQQTRKMMEEYARR